MSLHWENAGYSTVLYLLCAELRRDIPGAVQAVVHVHDVVVDVAHESSKVSAHGQADLAEPLLDSRLPALSITGGQMNGMGGVLWNMFYQATMQILRSKGQNTVPVCMFAMFTSIK